MLENMPPGRLFGLDQQTLVQIGIQLFNVSLLAYVLARLLYNPVRNFLSKRADRIKDQLESAGGELVKANELKTQYEQKLRNIELERTEILDAAHRLAIENSKKLLDEAKCEADGVKTRAAMTIELEQQRVKDEMKQVIIEVSSAMAEKFVALTIDKDAHDRLFAEAMNELKEVSFCHANTGDNMCAETTV